MSESADGELFKVQTTDNDDRNTDSRWIMCQEGASVETLIRRFVKR